MLAQLHAPRATRAHAAPCIAHAHVPHAQPKAHACKHACMHVPACPGSVALEAQSWHRQQLEAQPVLYIETTGLHGVAKAAAQVRWKRVLGTALSAAAAASGDVAYAYDRKLGAPRRSQSSGQSLWLTLLPASTTGTSQLAAHAASCFTPFGNSRRHSQVAALVGADWRDVVPGP